MVGESLIGLLIKTFKRKKDPINDVNIIRSPEPVKSAPVDVTPSRAFWTFYQNNTGRPILVAVSTIHTVTVQNAFLHVESTDDGMGAWGGWYNTPAVGTAMYSLLIFTVKVKGVYKVVENTAGGTNTILLWMETEL